MYNKDGIYPEIAAALCMTKNSEYTVRTMVNTTCSLTHQNVDACVNEILNCKKLIFS